jgi:hypothetical protein
MSNSPTVIAQRTAKAQRSAKADESQSQDDEDKDEEEEACTVRGEIVFDENFSKSWDGNKLSVPFDEIVTRLFERVQVPAVPFPKNWAEMKPEDRQKWIKAYDESDEGKAFIAKRNKIVTEANAFDVKFEEGGKFVVYDVPPSVYGLQGRVDKEIGGTKYAFEVFGQIEVLEDVDEIVLDPIQIAVTPLLESGQVAPPISVDIFKGNKTKLTLASNKGSYVFVNFWITSSPSAEYQKQIQEMQIKLKEKYKINLFSICVDEDREEAVKFIIKEKFKEGKHGFTNGMYHRAILDYGVRAIPSVWLVDPEGKILMSQFDFAQVFRANKSDLATAISDRIEGKDIPTLAKPTEGGSEEIDPPSGK